MKRYSKQIPPTTARHLSEIGMRSTFYSERLGDCEIAITATYGEVFDWFMSQGLSIEVYGRGSGYDFVICKECEDCTRGTRLESNNYDGPNDGGCWDDWVSAAEFAIMKAVQLHIEILKK